MGPTFKGPRHAPIPQASSGTRRIMALVRVAVGLPGGFTVALGSARLDFEATPVVDADHGVHYAATHPPARAREWVFSL